MGLGVGSSGIRSTCGTGLPYVVLLSFAGAIKAERKVLLLAEG